MCSKACNLSLLCLLNLVLAYEHRGPLTAMTFFLLACARYVVGDVGCVVPCVIIPWKVDVADLPKALKLLTHFIGPEIAPFSYSLQKCSISCEKSVREPDLYLASRGRFLTSSDTLCRDLSLYPRDMAGDSGPGRRYHACLLCEVAADIQPTASRRLLVYEASSSLQIQVYLHIQAKIEC